MKQIGIVRFLGTNCDRDIWQSVGAAGDSPRWLWYEDHFDCSEIEGIVVPGGFSYGDYLRAGALAARCPVMESGRKVTERRARCAATARSSAAASAARMRVASVRT